MTETFDLIVLGAGPAGGHAALEAAASGARVLLVDENPAAGGQVWRAPVEGLCSKAAPAGNAMRAALGASAVRMATAHRVWLVGEGFRVDALGPDGPVAWQAPTLVAATGTHERVIPFHGWTEPGVIGLAAATILLKAQGALPGKRVLLAGCGPLLAVVGSGVLAAGGSVEGIVDLAGLRDWLARAPALLARPDLAARGAGWAARIAAAGVPYHGRHALTAVERGDTGLVATLRPVDAGGKPVDGPTRQVEADAVAVGHGLVPDTALTRLLRAAHDWAPALGGWVPRLDENARTNVPGLYVAGDGAGVRGAAAAVWHGRIAGLAAAAQAAGVEPDSARLQYLYRRHVRAARFGAALAPLVGPRDAALTALPPETVICRCESVTRAEIEAAIDAGADELNQLKHWTRCGMGPCQGRFCGEAAAGLLGLRLGGRQRAGQWTGRAPLRPVDLAALAGQFDYDDIPVPPPAPL